MIDCWMWSHVSQTIVSCESHDVTNMWVAHCVLWWCFSFSFKFFFPKVRLKVLDFRSSLEVLFAASLGEVFFFCGDLLCVTHWMGLNVTGMPLNVTRMLMKCRWCLHRLLLTSWTIQSFNSQKKLFLFWTCYCRAFWVKSLDSILLS